MLWKRFLVALLGIPLILLLAYTGGLAFFLFVALLTCMTLREFFYLGLRSGLRPLFGVGYIGALTYIGIIYIHGDLPSWGPLWILILVLGGLLWYFPGRSLTDAAFTFLGLFYTAFLLSYLLLLRFSQAGFAAVTLAFIITWASDTGAYFAGLIFGRHRLWPEVSPHKTWEGALGALVLTLLAVISFGPWLFPQKSYGVLIPLGLSASVAAQIGDLIESALKRLTRVKDSGKILPGHGGLLDRFDSLLLVAPVVYYYLQWRFFI
ncbi:MAG: phosphatidate cytidylyltransferase [Clostridia bacterium]|nr:phosphatidate cytidylyltransferase [Clostridia bacterium]